MLVKDLIDILKNSYNPHDHIAYDIWCTEDVEEQAKEMGYNLKKSELKEIIEEVDRTKDATLGISWITIESCIEDYIYNRDGL